MTEDPKKVCYSKVDIADQLRWNEVYAVICYMEAANPGTYRFKICRNESELVEYKLLYLFDDNYELKSVRGPKLNFLNPNTI